MTEGQVHVEILSFCPKYERAVRILAKPWTPIVVRALLAGPRRFSQIREYTGHISDRVLSQRLKELEREGIVERRVIPSTPVRIEYALTPKGHELQQVVEAVQRWADRWLAVPDGH
ncbi:MAG: helix-turn-helix transcriptional regulator [Dehalococcoidia bacterium]|jgi:DNA-binding HxlR family transcriptional regulator|nr:helix-turn-helix transcriptional regulator [Dehalococcoidia bacterium]